MSEKQKNPKRVLAGKRRWANKTQEERSEHMRMMGKVGGKKLWEKIKKVDKKSKGV